MANWAEILLDWELYSEATGSPAVSVNLDGRRGVRVHVLSSDVGVGKLSVSCALVLLDLLRLERCATATLLVNFWLGHLCSTSTKCCDYTWAAGQKLPKMGKL